MDVSRRWLLGAALTGLVSAVARPALTQVGGVAGAVSPGLLRRALAALELHRELIAHRDFLGIADFSLPSRSPRFHLLNLTDGSVRSHWVAHGRGSDPAHTGWLERFSNEPRSNATSAGAFRTDTSYIGGPRPLDTSRGSRPQQQQRGGAGYRGARRVVCKRRYDRALRHAWAQRRLLRRLPRAPG